MIADDEEAKTRYEMHDPWSLKLCISTRLARSTAKFENFVLRTLLNTKCPFLSIYK
jgi:hypothetical protein